MIGAQYDVWIEGMKGTAKRSVCVIDAEGKLAYSEVLDSALDLPDFTKVKEALASL